MSEDPAVWEPPEPPLYPPAPVPAPDEDPDPAREAGLDDSWPVVPPVD